MCELAGDWAAEAAGKRHRVTVLPTRIEYLKSESTSALICIPFLDTDTKEDKRIADQVLAERGYAPFVVRVLRALAGVGLWYQVVLWEDFHLDLSDVLAGYGVIVGAMGVLVLLISWVWGIALLSLAVVLLLLAWLGWRRFRQRLDHARDVG